MSDSKKNTDDLIAGLCDDLSPTSPRCAYRRVAVWFLASVIYIVGVVWYSGPKIDIAEYMHSASFVFEMGLAIAVLISAALASSWLSFPDCVQRDWIKPVAATLFGSFLFWIFANGIEEKDFDLFQNVFLSSCSRGIIVEAIPFLGLIYLSFKGNTTQPYWTMAMNVIAVSVLGWIGLRFTCSMYDSMTYGFIHYLLPSSIIGIGFGLFARKLFKW